MQPLATPIDFEQSPPIKQKSFGLGDERVIQKLLRKRVYKNPLRVIPQEYASNARDAHREAGKDHLPIEIILPTVYDARLQIIDHGPGITPDRMENVFVIYGASTKHNDAKQTGGFGIGAKCAFAYSTSFSIITVTNKMKRLYTAFLDDKEMGELSLTQEIPVEEENSTTIIIPINLRDIRDITRWALFCTKYWNPRPVFINLSDNDLEQHGQVTDQFLLSGDQWAIAEEGFINDKGCTAIVDGIPYEIESDSFSRGLDHDCQTFIEKTPAALYFGVGEVELSGGRESLDYSEYTQDAIIRRIKKILIEIKDIANTYIDKALTMWEAMMALSKFRKIRGITSFSSNVFSAQWRGRTVQIEIRHSIEALSLDSEWHMCRRWTTVAKIRMYKKDGKAPGGIASEKWEDPIQAATNRLLCYAYEVVQTTIKGRVATLFDLHPTVDEIYVFSFCDVPPQVTVQWAEHYNWDLLNVVSLATIDRKGTIGESKTKEERVKTNAVVVGEQYVTYVSLTPEQMNTGGFYLARQNKSFICELSKEPLHRKELVQLLCRIKACDWMKVHSVNSLKIHGFLDKQKKAIGPNWKEFFAAMREKTAIWGQQNKNILPLLELTDTHTETHYDTRCVNIFRGVKLDLLPDNCIVRKYVKLLRLVSKIERKKEDLLNKYQVWKKFHKPLPLSVTIDKLMKDIQQKYPLLGMLDPPYDDSHSERFVAAIIHYIRLCDEQVVAQPTTVVETIPCSIAASILEKV